MDIVSAHAARRLADRGITVDQVDAVLRLQVGPPGPGDGNLTFCARMEGRVLEVVTSGDGKVLVTAYWKGRAS